MSDASSAAPAQTALAAATAQFVASPKDASRAAGEKRASCAPCRRAHQGCDGMRPCGRCVKTSQEANCVDQPPGSAPPRTPRTAPPAHVVASRGEGEGPPCQNCQFGSRTNPNCAFGRCRKCCLIARNDCPTHRDEVPASGGLSLRPRIAPSPQQSPLPPRAASSHYSASSSSAPAAALANPSFMATQQGGVLLSQAHTLPGNSAQPAGPPPPFRLAPARNMIDTYIYNPEPSISRPSTTPTPASVLVLCPSCHREVPRLGGALWAHMAHCNADLFAGYLAGTLEEIPSAAPVTSAVEAARASAAERYARHEALLTEIFSAQPSLETLATTELLADTLNTDERSATLQRVAATLERIASLRPGVATRADLATQKRDQFWQAYELTSSLSPAALATAADQAPPPVAPTLQQARALRVRQTTAKRKRVDGGEMVQL